MNIIILLLLFTSGHFRIYKYYFRWNSLMNLLFFNMYNEHKITDWLFIGNITTYRRILDEEKERLK